MCGIAGFSLHPSSAIEPQQLARVLLASIAERGADAAGCAWQTTNRAILTEKLPGGASHLLHILQIPQTTNHALLHVRDFTKGHPSLNANNHPIRHGSIIGVHNGKISNDEHIFRTLERSRFEPGMTVDSEAIFAALDADGHDQVSALERLRGSLATGWFDQRQPDRIFVARGHGRSLWIAETSDDRALLWASTLEAIEIVRDFLGLSLRARPVRAGEILAITHGSIIQRTQFQPDTGARWLNNPVASPRERRNLLALLRATRNELQTTRTIQSA